MTPPALNVVLTVERHPDKINLLTGHLESCVLSQDAGRHGDLLAEVKTALSQFLK